MPTEGLKRTPRSFGLPPELPSGRPGLPGAAATTFVGLPTLLLPAGIGGGFSPCEERDVTQRHEGQPRNCGHLETVLSGTWSMLRSMP